MPTNIPLTGTERRSSFAFLFASVVARFSFLLPAFNSDFPRAVPKTLAHALFSAMRRRTLKVRPDGKRSLYCELQPISRRALVALRAPRSVFSDVYTHVRDGDVQRGHGARSFPPIEIPRGDNRVSSAASNGSRLYIDVF